MHFAAASESNEFLSPQSTYEFGAPRTTAALILTFSNRRANGKPLSSSEPVMFLEVLLADFRPLQ